MFPLHLALAFALKLALTGLLASRLRPWCGSALEAVVAAWTLSFSILFALMLALSPAHALGGAALTGALGAALAALAVPALRDRRGPAPPQDPLCAGLRRELLGGWAGKLTALAVLLIFAALTARSFYFFDTTADALAYGLPRISIFAQRASLFAADPTQALNIVVNEWNGELNALYYVLLTGWDQASSFGNAEVWLFLVAVFSWFAGILGAGKRAQLSCGLIAASAPVVLALAMTVKGDALAMGGLALAAGWLLCFIRAAPAARPFPFVVALAAIGLACGAKVVLLPALLPVAGLLVWAFLRRPSLAAIPPLAAGIAALGAGLSRYALNALQFGNPLIRVEGEALAFSLLQALRNLRGIALGCAGLWFRPWFPEKGFFRVLTGDLGLWGPLLILLPLWLWRTHGRRPDGEPGSELANGSGRLETAAACCLAGGFLLLLCVTRWHEWSFRYFAPWLLPLLLAAAVRLGQLAGSRRAARLLPVLLIAVAVLHLAICLQPGGEVRPTSFTVAAGRSQLERKLALHHYYLDPRFNLQRAPCVSGRGCRVLIYNYVEQKIYPFFGDDHANAVTLADSAPLLLARAAGNRFDLVVVTYPFITPELAAALRARGYAPAVESEDWALFAPADR